jgi:hypothetical protein
VNGARQARITDLTGDLESSLPMMARALRRSTPGVEEEQGEVGPREQIGAPGAFRDPKGVLDLGAGLVGSAELHEAIAASEKEPHLARIVAREARGFEPGLEVAEGARILGTPVVYEAETSMGRGKTRVIVRRFGQLESALPQRDRRSEFAETLTGSRQVLDQLCLSGQIAIAGG